MTGHTVVEVHGIRVTVEIDGALRRCAPLPGMEPYPAVGDRVAVGPPGQPDDPPSVTAVLPRRTTLARPRGDRSRRSRGGAREHVLAANVDLAVVVAARARPPFHPRFIDRAMVLAQRGGIDVAVALNKADLGVEPPDLSVHRGLGLRIVDVSARTGAGLEDLRRLIAGRTVVFTGRSGVGKSSLVNALHDAEPAAVGAVGGRRGQGRHTTSRSSLYRLDATTAIIDTPGVRSLPLAGIPPDELDGLFPEFAERSARCRFRDCVHDREPGCEVRAAVAAGAVAASRYDTYLRLLRDDG